MSDPNWDAGVIVNVPAKPAQGNWTMALEYVDAAKRLKLVVSATLDTPKAAAQVGGGQQATQAAVVAQKNQWNYATDRACSANGDPKAPINSANCLITDAPPGALIAKLGGSIAGKTSDGLKSFVVGSFCIIDLDDRSKGTLYLTMNADPMGALERTGQLSVTVYRSG